MFIVYMFSSDESGRFGTLKYGKNGRKIEKEEGRKHFFEVDMKLFS